VTSPRPTTVPQRSTTVGAPTTYVYLLVAEIEARALGRRLEWLAVANPPLASSARAAYWLAGRLRGDRLGVLA
jgi:hypothetical protein